MTPVRMTGEKAHASAAEQAKTPGEADALEVGLLFRTGEISSADGPRRGPGCVATSATHEPGSRPTCAVWRIAGANA